MELDEKLEDFRGNGIDVVAISCNTRELAARSVEQWGLRHLTIGCGLTLEQARQWGLFVSAAVNDGEPPHFTEPGTFVVRPDGTLYWSIVQSMPFTRPPATLLLKALQFAIDKDYPARGEHR